jgi:hypothetical protein
MNRLFWSLPAWTHHLVRRLTGYRLVKITGLSFGPVYVWSKSYPLSPRG